MESDHFNGVYKSIVALFEVKYNHPRLEFVHKDHIRLRHLIYLSLQLTTVNIEKRKTYIEKKKSNIFQQLLYKKYM